jgi:hypothetical protein
MNIQSKLTEISRKLKDTELKTEITTTKTGPVFNKKEGIQILVSDVPESKYIDISAQIQTILRESLGYGTVKTNYALELNQLDLEYIPIPNAKIASTRSDYTREQHRQYRPASTPGCTNPGK